MPQGRQLNEQKRTVKNKRLTRFQRKVHQTRKEYLEKETVRGQPHGQVANFAHSALAALGSPVQVLSGDLHMAHQACCASISQRRTRMTYNYDIQLYTGALGIKKKEEDWLQMLAQGQSSSTKSIP